MYGPLHQILSAFSVLANHDNIKSYAYSAGWVTASADEKSMTADFVTQV